MNNLYKIRLGLLLAKIRLNGIYTRDTFREEDHPRDEAGKFAKSGSTTGGSRAKITTSAQGANKFSKYGFINKAKQRAHEKHLGEFEGLTMEQYIKRGMDLIQMPTGGDILGHKDKDGILTRYSVKTNEFVKGRPDRGIYTLYKPKDGKAYYDYMKEQDLKHGGEE